MKAKEAAPSITIFNTLSWASVSGRVDRDSGSLIGASAGSLAATAS
jgi:hypothetical protein